MRLVKMSSTKKSTARFYILTVSALACLVSLARAQDSPVDRTALPLAEPSYPPITELDVRKATPPPRFEVKAPDRAPNVLVILLDNLGYGATKPFGGVIEMPTLERLARPRADFERFSKKCRTRWTEWWSEVNSNSRYRFLSFRPNRGLRKLPSSPPKGS